MNKKLINVALAGNPNCGKTTLFNNLTGAKQRIGNWPGVTVEKKEGTIKYKNFDINIVDLPGIYSLSAYSEDEKVTRDYLLSGKPDLVINIIDATNLERNLYLTSQLILNS
jgi:ferrous iron transport protein B